MRKIAFVFALLIGFTTSCKKDSGGSNNNQPGEGYTVFKNQTGDPNADALQAQLVDKNQQIRFYGKFDAQGNPSQVTTATYQKVNNDTTVYMITNPVTDQLELMYFEVKGVKQPLVMKFAFFPGNDSSFRLSVHHYDWTAKTSALQYESMVFAVDGEFFNDPLYGNFKITTPNWYVASHLLSLSLVIVHAVLSQQSLFGLASYIPALSYLNNTWSYILAGLLQTQLAMMHFSSAQPAPSSSSYPGNTPPSNPSVNPSANLSSSPCSNTTISFFADMDEQGKISFFDVQGGQPPYKYSATGLGGFETSATLAGTYQKGKKYNLTVRDAKGCMGSLIMSW